MKVLLAHDGSRHADDAIADLSRAGLPDGSEVQVFSVADVWVGPSAPPEVPTTPEQASSQAALAAAITRAHGIAAAAAEAVRARFPSWKVTSDATAGAPAWEIVWRADEWKPDLVVVGATGRSAFERVAFGTVASLVLTHVRCSVRVARLRSAASGPVRIIVAVDGSPGSARAVESAARRRWPAGSEVRVVEAVGEWSLAPFFPHPEPSQAVGNAVTTLGKSGLSATAMVGTGDPKRVLLEQASSWPADAIFVGARGLRAVERFLVGAVSTAIASRATCSVEVVRG